MNDAQQTYHVAGVAGVGMSALAELLLGLGCRVTGSDRSFDQGVVSETLLRLQRMGLDTRPQDGSAVQPSTRALLVSTAIESDNPEMAAARRHGVEVVHRAAMLARLAKDREVIAIAGTAGKTTVTALTGWLLEQAGLDPTVVNGGVILNWSTPDRLGNVRVGKTGPWVFEVDESDRSLLNFSPRIAAVTNISKDHFELEEVTGLFRAFTSRVAGATIAGRGVDALIAGAAVQIDPEPPWKRTADGFEYRGTHFHVPLIGHHNKENALTAVRLCEHCGVDLRTIADMLPDFKGVGRRLERVGTFGGCPVYDDYAHNPAKIAASWQAVAESASPVVGFWRPHGFGPLNLMKDELADALSKCMGMDDHLLVLPVYYAGGTAKAVITSEQWVESLRQRGLRAAHVGDYAVLAREIELRIQRGGAILGLGARDPQLSRFARELAARG